MVLISEHEKQPFFFSYERQPISAHVIGLANASVLPSTTNTKHKVIGLQLMFMPPPQAAQSTIDLEAPDATAARTERRIV
jgi:hypothetical protein